MDLFPVDWQARDVGGQYTITVTGKTQSHELVCAHIKFFPYCLVRLDGCGRGQTSLFVTQACRDHKALREYCRVVERVPLIGFTNGKKITLALLAFHSRRQMTAAARAYEGAGMATYESGVDPLLRFFHNREIAPAQWIRLDSYAPAADRTTRAPVEVVTTYDKVRASAVTARPPLVLACFDLECYSAERKFPCADNEDDCIIQIATCFQRYGEPEPYRTLVLALRETAAAEGVEVVCFDDEADVINAWCDELAAESADVLVSYNGDQFDWKYLLGRTLVCVDDETGEPRVRLRSLGRMQQGGGERRESTLNSSAYGNNEFVTATTPGILQIDLLQIFRKSLTLDDYSLDGVSSKFLGDTKVDLPAGAIFDKFDGTPQDRAVIAGYAAKDVQLPLRLLRKMCTLENIIEMANATFCPADYIVHRGQQIRVFSVLMKKARAMGYVCRDNSGIGPQGKFAGATVLDAQEGAYFDIVAGLDFASLYPSIMRAWELDYSTLVLDPAYDNLPGVEYYEVETDQGTFRFAQGFKGVLPSLLEDLAHFRKAAKKKMADAKERGDSFAAAIHNSEQLAFKIVMNT